MSTKHIQTDIYEGTSACCGRWLLCLLDVMILQNGSDSVILLNLIEEV